MTFSFGGNNYTIDLNEANAEALRNALAPYGGWRRSLGRGFGTWRPGRYAVTSPADDEGRQ
ncbi:histone-like nucleoid-structuring protein Lsr2 [Actinoplanes sp. NPDC051859]|uniref:Lsr2 dimerization domain-containing protein n=1 Tax=Actinoplanes sp. NPDC051859 TaxID=3363909 RepID=UPI00379CB36E